jgi:hypothetical protein
MGLPRREVCVGPIYATVYTLLCSKSITILLHQSTIKQMGASITETGYTSLSYMQVMLILRAISTLKKTHLVHASKESGRYSMTLNFPGGKFRVQNS